MVRATGAEAHAGRDLALSLAALQQWGDAHLPRDGGPTIEQRSRRDGRPVHVAFVDERGREIALPDVEAHRTAAYPS